MTSYHDTLFDDFSSLLLAGKLILNEGGHLPFLVFRRLDFEYSLQPMRQKNNKPGITKGKMGKVRQGMVRGNSERKYQQH
jgi:hypothetical protein